MTPLLLGITGSIAAYKTPDLVRRLLEAGFDVHVVLTESAKQFVSPLVLQTLLPGKVFDTLLEPSMHHITLAKWADAILVAPFPTRIFLSLLPPLPTIPITLQGAGLSHSIFRTDEIFLD